MQTAKLLNKFRELVPPPWPADWEIEETLLQLAELSAARQDLIMQQIPAIWPVSNSLCFSYLDYAAKALSCLDSSQIMEWVAAILDTYEKKGLKKAQNFMADTEGNYLCHLRGETGLELATVDRRLKTYGQGVVDRPITLASGPDIYTDTEKIFLPRKLAEFRSEKDNFLYYKLILTTQLAVIKCNTYKLEIKNDSPLGRALAEGYGVNNPPDPILLTDFIDIFPDTRLAADIFNMAEGQRLGEYLAADFPGLWRDTEHLRTQLAKRRPCPADPEHREMVIECLARQAMTGKTPDWLPRAAGVHQWVIDHFREPARSAADSALKTTAIYALLSSLPAGYTPIPPLPWLGRLRPEEATRVRRQRRMEAKEKFIEAMTKILPRLSSAADPEKDDEESALAKAAQATAGSMALVIPPAAAGSDQDEPPPEHLSDQTRFLTVDNQQLAMPPSMMELATEIRNDLGQIPAEYISAAMGLAGSAPPPSQPATAPSGESLTGALTYDEWDYRRKGFRKSWCLLNEKAVRPVKGTFVANTLEKHRGLLRQLKKQFEMLRNDERFIKRQKDGDDIDLDAVIESTSDITAGLPGSDNLFIRLQREERDIAVMFLIDMSSSTEGWVGEALKEALILMGESLEILGDRYAIAGFSGMRRTRADFYRIKDFAEPYKQEIKDRIAGISPQEYTRMGPPLRHAVKILRDVEARIRLLIVLSDGKPEDYDDYKGKYAIEDTRHALIEAKAEGIHPFCIAIDQQAHDYISHMYGEVNYIFLDEVRKLPARMPDIYRILTS